ncbi:hypothetical protein [Histidinibacterium lentulum]|uniref:Uncharacterized protein n=1 Tax=Histidinibacterium lentulum TaxID=2480588 RepID=A0A3N2QS05_9RHOB|nr:hypothetical protein [Histidinibacterium lentulum]ROT97986.1 hypothetical protein EAT49_17070 [Histidinibacterium lentulum]
MTRTIALAVAALLGTATLASATSTFGIVERQGSSANIELGLVRSEAPATVEIFSGDRLLGSTTVRAGANDNVRVNVGRPPVSNLTAVLSADGEVLATTVIDVDRNDR